MFKSNVIIEKKDTPISRQYDNLLSRSERDVRVALRRWFADMTKQVQQALTSQFSKARKDITTYLTDWTRIEDNGKVILQPVVREVTRKGGQLSYKNLGITDKFDVNNVRSVSNVNKHCAKLVREVTTETKKGIRAFIRAGIKEGKGMPQIARDLRPIVGLTKRQVQSVANYKRMLKEAGQPADRIKKRVRKYRDKTHRRRMQTIARTETARAQNFGYVQGMEEIGINQVEFLIAAGACEICINLNTERFSIEEAEAVIPVHPNCRCAMLPVINDRMIQRPLVSAPPDLPGVMAPVKDLQPWRQYLASHRGGDKNVSALLYDWYKLNYQATGRLAPSAKKFLLKGAKRFEAASVKISVKIPGMAVVPPPVVKIPQEVQDLITRWKAATSRSSKWTYGNKLKKLGYDVKTSVYKPLGKPVPSPKPLTPTEVKPGILPKSHYNEAPGDWEKRLVAHKEDLRARLKTKLGFNIDDLKLSRMDKSDVKEAVKRFESAVKSFTKPTTNLTKAKGAVNSYDITSSTPTTSQAAKGAKKQVAKVFERLEEIGCDDLMNVFNRRTLSTKVHGAARGVSFRAHAEITRFRINVSLAESTNTVFHEIGHLLEHNPNLKRKAQSWVAARGKNVRMRWGDIRPWATESHARQYGYKDKFIDSYVGKVYTTGVTEVMSTGLQQFSSYKSMLRFAKKDFDHFSFIHGILTGAI